MDNNIITLSSFAEDNVTIRGKKLVTISVKNDKGEILSLNSIFEQLRKYCEENEEKVENTVGLIGSYGVGPFFDLQRPFILGYLYAKYMEKLQKEEDCKYEVEYTERELTEDEARNLLADLIDKNVNLGKDLSKKLRDGNINPEDIKMV